MSDSPKPVSSFDSPDGDAAPKRSLWQRLGPAGMLGLLWTVAPALCGILLLANIDPISQWLLEHKTLGVFLYTTIFILSAGFGLLPTYAQSILGGWVFGVVFGFPAAMIGFVGAAIIGYAIARTVAKDRVERIVEENVKARAIRDMLVGHGPWRTLGIVTLLRLPPNSPFALTNLVMASTGVARVPFIVGTALGMAPRTFVAVFLASEAAKTARDIQTFIKEGPGPVVFIGGFVVMFIVLGVIGSLAKTALKRVTRSPAGRA